MSNFRIKLLEYIFHKLQHSMNKVLLLLSHVSNEYRITTSFLIINNIDLSSRGQGFPPLLKSTAGRNNILIYSNAATVAKVCLYEYIYIVFIPQVNIVGLCMGTKQVGRYDSSLDHKDLKSWQVQNGYFFDKVETNSSVYPHVMQSCLHIYN